MSLEWQISLEKPVEIQYHGRDVRGVDLSKDSCWTENHFSIHWVLLYFHHPVELVIDEHWLTLSSNTVTLVPPHANLTLRFTQYSEHEWIHFSAASGRGTTQNISVSYHLKGADADQMTEKLGMILATDKTDASHELTRLLKDLCASRSNESISIRGAPPEFCKAIEIIEHSLHKPLYAPEIATSVGLPQRQLLGLFKETTGKTIVGYIRQRRSERAYDLLLKTNRTIQSIAIEVGLSDLQLFNKTIRHFYGKSPRSLRRSQRFNI